MTVAALLDLGADPEHLVKTLESLPLDGWKAEISNVTKSGLRVCDFNVILEHDNHDHDMEYLHGHSHTHDHDHHHGHEHHQDHAETAGHHHDPVQAEVMHAQEETGHEEHHHHHHHGEDDFYDYR